MLEFAPVNSFVECEQETERNDDQEAKHPDQKRHSGSRLKRKTKQFRENDHSGDLYSTTDAGDLDDTAERDKSNKNNNIDERETRSGGERPKQEVVASHDNRPFQHRIEKQQGQETF